MELGVFKFACQEPSRVIKYSIIQSVILRLLHKIVNKQIRNLKKLLYSSNAVLLFRYKHDEKVQINMIFDAKISVINPQSSLSYHEDIISSGHKHTKEDLINSNKN